MHLKQLVLGREVGSIFYIAVRNRTVPSVNKLEMLLGKVIRQTRIGTDRKPCVQVRCKLNEFDDHIKKYFSRPVDLWALDVKLLTALGDTVLITKCDGKEQPTKSITHTIDRVVFKYGYVIDPITNKRVIRQRDEDELKLQAMLVKEILEDPADHDVLLFDEKRDIQRRRLETRKLSIERRTELAKLERTLAQRTVEDAELESDSKKDGSSEDDYPYW